MSISFILRMISGAISNKDDKTTPRISINKEIDRARKRAAKSLNRAKLRAQEEMGEADRVRITIMSGDMKKFTNEFTQIKNVNFQDCAYLSGLERFVKEIVDIHRIRGKSGNDWVKYTESEKILIGRTVQIAHLISVLSEVRFMTDEAELRPEISHALEEAEELLDELGA